MKNHVYKLIELTGTSTVSIEDAVNTAIQRAGKTIKNPCKPCNGQGRVREEKKLSVKIPAGVDTGDRIRLTGVFSFILYSLVGSIMFEVGYYFISNLLEQVPTSAMFVDRTLQVLMNFILSYPLYFILEFADRAFSEKPDWHRTSMDYNSESLL